MSRERMPEDAAHIRRARRARRARHMRRVRGCLLSIALMVALAVYAGGRAAHRPAENAQPRPGSETAQPAQTAAPDDTAREPDPSQPEELFASKELEELVSGVLGGLVTGDMTQIEQARAVFDYVHDNIYYTGHSDKSDWESGAYAGLTTGKGDCFTYYAVSRALLTALEIDNLPVERVGGEAQHFWNLVDCGGGWYHFDACPRSSKLPPFVSFMVTDRQVADFTAEAGRNYYDFDGSLLPERAAEIITEN